MLEVGAGAGNNLYFFLRQGFAWNQLYANELLPERVQRLLEVHPKSENILKGDLLELEPEWDAQFDIVFQSVVFSSVLQPAVRQMLAHKMTELLAPNGVILWYDFTVDNPKNKDVRGVKRREVEGYFPGFEWEWRKVTLLPPLARKVGLRYPLVNSFLPMLRTHLLGVGKRA
jgi:SAM-dependent methyltransferase